MMMSRSVIPRLPALGTRLASSSSSSSRSSSRPSLSRRRQSSRTSSRGTPPPTPNAATAAIIRRRRIVLTGAVALVTAVGAITGARLKMDRDETKHQTEVLELPLDERIAMLESRRSGLVSMKMPLERKLIGLRERVEAEKKEVEERA